MEDPQSPCCVRTTRSFSVCGWEPLADVGPDCVGITEGICWLVRLSGATVDASVGGRI